MSARRRIVKPAAPKPATPPSVASAGGSTIAQLALLGLVQSSGTIFSSWIAADQARQLGESVLDSPMAMTILAAVAGLLLWKT